MAGNIFEVSQKVYFSDTDSLGIVYYSRHLEWLEMARIEFLTKIYKPVTQMMAQDKICFLPISVHIHYKTPAVFEDVVKIKLFFKEIGKHKLSLVNVVLKENNGKEILVSETEMTMLCIGIDKGNRPTKIPDHLQELFQDWQIKHYTYREQNITA
jgi:YbgC/YbaW family acyl-CoA thioester hydrolase